MNIYYLTLIFSLLISHSVPAETTALDLPDIGDSSGSIISPALERRMGLAFMRSVRQKATVIDDPEVENYIKSIGYKLVANSDNNSLPFSFFVVKNPAINAFAAPGGVIGINSGTILNSQSESELAGVIAHEIAHVTQRHIARSFEKANQYTIPATAGMLGAILLTIVNPELGQAALTAVSGASLQARINFTRANEKEADSIGILLLARSGYDPHGMPAFFERLQQKSEYQQSQAPEFLRTHPLTSSRIAESKARAASYAKVDYADTMNYALVHAKLEVDNYRDKKDAVRVFAKRLAEQPDQDAIRYGYSLALMTVGDYQGGREELNILLSKDKENIAYLLVAAQLEVAQKNYAEALDIFRGAYQIYPDYQPLILRYAKALIDVQQADQARDLLRHYRRRHEPGPLYYNLLAQAEAQSGALVDSDMTRAEYFYLIGNTKRAIEILLQTQQQYQLSQYQREKMIARLAQLEYELRLEKKLKL